MLKTVVANRLFPLGWIRFLLVIVASITLGCGGGGGGSSQSITAINPPTTAPPTTTTPPVSLANNDFYGMHMGFGFDAQRSVPGLKALGVKWVRVWININWSDRSEPAQFQLVRDLSTAGFKTIVLFSQVKVPTYAEVKDYFDWAQSTGIGQFIDVWEILNELNLTQYWQGGPTDYVEQVLKPAYASLHSQGEMVLGGSVTAWQKRADGSFGWGTTVTQQYVAAGYLDYVDFAGSHPYTNTVDEMKTHIDAVKAAYGSKPIILSEWNFKQKSDLNAWKAQLDAARPYIAERVKIAVHYRYLQISSNGGWPGIVTQDFRPSEPFYSMYLAWPK